MDNWQILGIPRGSPPDDIKKAFRKLAHIYHPDKGGDPEQFKKINRAYTELKNGQSGTKGNHSNSSGDPFDRYDYSTDGTAWKKWKANNFDEILRKWQEEMNRKQDEQRQQYEEQMRRYRYGDWGQPTWTASEEVEFQRLLNKRRASGKRDL